MWHFAGMAASAVAVVLVLDVASAASITNRDDRDHKVMVMAAGERAREQVLEPNGVLSDVCPKGCVVRLNDKAAQEYELEGPETVSIEGGLLYYDGPEASTEPVPEAVRPDGRKR